MLDESLVLGTLFVLLKRIAAYSLTTLYVLWFIYIVALNYQTNGEFMDINNGFFSQNGRSGYIKKPACLRERFLAYDPSATLTRGVPGVVSKKYTIVSISGQQLPKPSGSSRRGEVISYL